MVLVKKLRSNCNNHKEEMEYRNETERFGIGGRTKVKNKEDK